MKLPSEFRQCPILLRVHLDGHTKNEVLELSDDILAIATFLELHDKVFDIYNSHMRQGPELKAGTLGSELQEHG